MDNPAELATLDIMTVSPVIPVIAIDDAERAIDLAHALIAGGIRVLEITLRTPAALRAIELLVDQVPDAVVGAGTVTNTNQLRQVIDTGAQFAITPGSTSELLELARQREYPILPGVATASEIMNGLQFGYEHFKLFPAEVAGGIEALKAFSGPFNHVRFCPTGGVSEANFQEYLKLENVLCVGGSWVAPASLINAGKFEDITDIAASAIRNINE